MSSQICSEQSSKRQRIMIVMADQNLIDQIEKSNNVSLLKQIVLPSDNINKNNNQTSTKQNKVERSSKKMKIKDSPLTCVVCGSSATGYNFGAIVCESCKAFFRRNARKDSNKFQCNNNGQCQIRVETRRDCPSCRLTKCFNSGMQCDRLSTSEQKAAKRRQLEENKTLALNLNSKTNEEDIQLSSSIVFQDSLQSIDTDVLLADLTSFLSSEPEQSLLSQEDFERIETISRLYQNRIESAAHDGLPWDPSSDTKNFSEVINSISVSVMRLLSFFKQIPEFNQLNVDDKVTLVKYNLLTILGINCALSYNTETNQIKETDSDLPAKTEYFQIAYGYQACKQMSKVFASFLHIAKFDPKILQLTLIILILTKGFSITNFLDESILNDGISVYRAQTYFTELLWKYIETTYGYNQAIHLSSQLIFHVTSWQTIHDQMRNDLLRTLSPDDLDQLVPIMKSILRIN